VVIKHFVFVSVDRYVGREHMDQHR